MGAVVDAVFSLSEASVVSLVADEDAVCDQALFGLANISVPAVPSKRVADSFCRVERIWKFPVTVVFDDDCWAGTGCHLSRWLIGYHDRDDEY